MAVTTTNALKLKVRYDDYTTRNYTFNDIDSASTSSIKTKIQAFNAELANTSSAKRTAYRDTFVGKYDEETHTQGAPIKDITAASYIVTEEEVVYGG